MGLGAAATTAIDPEQVGICDRRDWQALSGLALRAYILAPRDVYRLLTGQGNIYVKAGENGVNRAQGFCFECGTPIVSAAPDDPQVCSIRAGTARQRSKLMPRGQMWRRFAQTWLVELESRKQLVEQVPLRL